jgi:hypothetical protein
MNLTPGQLHRIGQLTDQWSFSWDKRRSLWIARRGLTGGALARRAGRQRRDTNGCSSHGFDCPHADQTHRSSTLPGRCAVLSRDCALHSPKTYISSAWQLVPEAI